MRRRAAALATGALVALVALVGCATPQILVQDDPSKLACGQWPVDCGHGRCCFEGDRCIVEPDGKTPACENVGEIGGARHRYTPGVAR